MSGILSIVFGLILVIRPMHGLESLLFVIGFYALLIGILQLILAFESRGWATKLAAGS